MWRAGRRASSRLRVGLAGGGAILSSMGGYYVVNEASAPKQQTGEGLVTIEVWEEEKQTVIRPYIRNARLLFEEEAHIVKQYYNNIRDQGAAVYERLGLKHVDNAFKGSYDYAKEKPVAAVVGAGTIATTLLLRRSIGWRAATVVSLAGAGVALYINQPEIFNDLADATTERAKGTADEALQQSKHYLDFARQKRHEAWHFVLKHLHLEDAHEAKNQEIQQQEAKEGEPAQQHEGDVKEGTLEHGEGNSEEKH